MVPIKQVLNKNQVHVIGQNLLMLSGQRSLRPMDLLTKCAVHKEKNVEK